MSPVSNLRHLKTATASRPMRWKSTRRIGLLQIARWLMICTAACLIAGWAARPLSAQDQSPRIAAAANVKFALDEIIVAFQRDTGRNVTPVYGSSGNFKTQILQGAPFEMFLSADEGYIFDLAGQGLTAGQGEVYATGRIVLFAPQGAAWAPDETFSSLKSALADGGITRFAIASPEHAPYGRAAEDALRQAGLWDMLKHKLVFGENVSQAAQFATSGSAQGGIIPLSLALAPQFAGRGTYALLPASTHQPLAQRMVLLKTAGETAKAFYRYIKTPSVTAIFERYGYSRP